MIFGGPNYSRKGSNCGHVSIHHYLATPSRIMLLPVSYCLVLNSQQQCPALPLEEVPMRAGDNRKTWQGDLHGRFPSLLSRSPLRSVSSASQQSRATRQWGRAGREPANSFSPGRVASSSMPWRLLLSHFFSGRALWWGGRMEDAFGTRPPVGVFGGDHEARTEWGEKKLPLFSSNR